MNKKTKSKSSKPTTTEPLEIAENQKSAAALWGIPVAIQKLAKSQGCQAFKSGRVHRQPLLEWVKQHANEAEAAVACDLAKADKTELEKEKIRAQIILLRSRNDREAQTTIPREVATAVWMRAAAIWQEEVRMFLPREQMAIVVQRAQTRIGNVFED